MTEPNWPTEADMNDLADDLLGIVLPEGSGARLITRALELWGRPAIQPVLDKKVCVLLAELRTLIDSLAHVPGFDIDLLIARIDATLAQAKDD